VSPTPAPDTGSSEPVKAVARPIRTPDADDHLAAYFRQLAEHELLTPEDERELSQGIEDTEIMTWERVFARAEVVAPILALIEPNLEQPVKFPKLAKAVEDCLKVKRKDTRLQKKLQAAAREAAQGLRALDLDRVHIDAVVRELYRAREAALVGEETWWLEGATKDAAQFVDDLRQAHRDAAALRDEFVREPASRRHDGASLRPWWHAARGPDPGGQPRAHARGVALRLSPRSALLDVCVLVDPPRDRSCTR